MNDKQTETEVIFRAGQLFEIDMAASALEEHGVPHYTQEETSSGLKLAWKVYAAIVIALTVVLWLFEILS